MDNMERTGVFSQVGATLEERINEQGQLQASLETIYLPTVGHAAGRVGSRGRAMTLGWRIIQEHRGYLWPLTVALLINVARLRVRRVSARRQIGHGRRPGRRGRGVFAWPPSATWPPPPRLVKGKTTAEQELATFYQKVLPPSLDAARRLTYAKLPALARKANVKFEERRSDIDLQQQRQKNTRLGRLQTRIVLEGDYESLRQLLYELETTPEFLIVDDVGVTQPRRTRRSH